MVRGRCRGQAQPDVRIATTGKTGTAAEKQYEPRESGREGKAVFHLRLVYRFAPGGGFFLEAASARRARGRRRTVDVFASRKVGGRRRGEPIFRHLEGRARRRKKKTRGAEGGDWVVVCRGTAAGPRRRQKGGRQAEEVNAPPTPQMTTFPGHGRPPTRGRCGAARSGVGRLATRAPPGPPTARQQGR